MSAGVIQGIFPAFAQRSVKQSISDEVEARINALANQGFALFRPPRGVPSGFDHFVVSPHGVFAIKTEANVPGRHRINEMLHQQLTICRTTQLPPSIPIRPMVCIPKSVKSGSDPGARVKVIGVVDLVNTMQSFPRILSVHQVLTLSALLWIRWKRR